MVTKEQYEMEAYMTFVIIEIQKYNNGTVAVVPPTSYSDQWLAEQAYHTALAAAAASQVEIHSVTMLNETGDRLKGETYDHRALIPNNE